MDGRGATRNDTHGRVALVAIGNDTHGRVALVATENSADTAATSATLPLVDDAAATSAALPVVDDAAATSAALPNTDGAALPQLPQRRHPSRNSVMTYHDNRSILMYVTVVTEKRKAILADKAVHDCIVAAWKATEDWLVGRYVIMSDHIHFFCAPATYPPPDFHRWVKLWKAQVSRTFPIGLRMGACDCPSAHGRVALVATGNDARGRAVTGNDAHGRVALVATGNDACGRAVTGNDAHGRVALVATENDARGRAVTGNDAHGRGALVATENSADTTATSAALPLVDDAAATSAALPNRTGAILPRLRLPPLFQRDCWDRQLRTGESYVQKWEYVRNNPVRKGLVVRADDWPFQGQVNVLEWHERV